MGTLVLLRSLAAAAAAAAADDDDDDELTFQAHDDNIMLDP